MTGDYYLGVSLMREDYSIEFPFTIEVEIVGEPAEGPTYADDATWTVADGAVYPGEPTDPTDTSDATEEAGPVDRRNPVDTRRQILHSPFCTLAGETYPGDIGGS